MKNTTGGVYAFSLFYFFKQNESFVQRDENSSGKTWRVFFQKDFLPSLKILHLTWSQVCPRDPGPLKPWIPGTRPGTIPGFASKVLPGSGVEHLLPTTSITARSVCLCRPRCPCVIPIILKLLDQTSSLVS